MFDLLVGAQGVSQTPNIKYLAQRCGRKGAVEAQKVFPALPSPSELQATYDAALQSRRRDRGAAQSMVEAVMYALRSYGIDTFSRPNCQRMLGDLSDVQVEQVIKRLIGLHSQYPTTITDKLLRQLTRLLP